jgi:hypothetical protein
MEVASIVVIRPPRVRTLKAGYREYELLYLYRNVHLTSRATLLSA